MLLIDHTGYKNGDLALWTLVNNLVIFVKYEELSGNTGNLTILGKIEETQQVLDSLSGTLNVVLSVLSVSQKYGLPF